MIKLELSDFYKNMSPVELVRELGHVFATVLAERGHKIDERSPLMNGIVAYEMLSLKGDPLEAISKLMPWEMFRADIESVVLIPTV